MVDQYFGNDSLEPFESKFIGSVDPFHLMEVPTARLPNVKMLLRWPSGMQILEQFDGTIEWKATERSEGAYISDRAKRESIY